jgi:uncharacterized protein DUF6352
MPPHEPRSTMKDFWLSSGHHLLDRDTGGGLLVTDEYLKAYLARPELAPPAEACIGERTLHAALLLNPRRAVSAAEIARVADFDARENWSVMIQFRDHLISHTTLEAAYLAIVRQHIHVPPLFINQLVHAILRNLLDRCEDPFVLRAAELFFRPQRLTVHNGSLIAADEELITSRHAQPITPLVAMLDLPAPAEVDVLNDDNCAEYWLRSDAFDMALDLTAGRRGLAALGEVIERWIAHLLAVEVRVQALSEAKDIELNWYVGLDTEATAAGDTLWRGEELDEAARDRIIGLYALRFCDEQLLIEKARAEPTYILMAMDADRVLRLKPQNLITGLPMRALERVA